MLAIPSRQRITISSVAEDFNNCDLMLTKETRMATWNVNSIRKRIKNGQFYAIFDCDADILVLTEIRCKVDQLFSCEDFWSALETRGYRYCAWHSARDGALKHGYAGIAILSKLAPVSFIFGFQNDEDMEGRVLTIRFKDALLIGAYCPARPEYMPNFLKNLESHNHLLKEKLDLPVFLIGDINMIGAECDAIEHSVPYPNATQMCRDYFNALIVSMGLSDAALVPNSNSTYNAREASKNITWYERPHRPKFGMRIDYILVPQKFSSLVRDYTRLAVIGSDHLPISCCILSKSGQKREVAPFSSQNGLYHLLNLTGVSQMQQPKLTQNDCKLLRAVDKLMLETPTLRPKHTGYHTIAPPIKTKTSTPRIELKVGRWRYANALIDTGSTYCLIDREVVREILLETPTAGKIIEIQPILLSLGDGSTANEVNPNGVIMLEVNFETRCGKETGVCQKFFICPKLNELLVIGHRFFQDNRHKGADISYEKNSLLLKGFELPWNNTKVIPESNHTLTGVLCENHNITPNETRECRIQLFAPKKTRESGNLPQKEQSVESKIEQNNSTLTPTAGLSKIDFFTNDLVVEEGVISHARIRNDGTKLLSLVAGIHNLIPVCEGVSLEYGVDKLALDALRVRSPRRDDSLSTPMYSEDTDRTGAVLSKPTSSGGSVCPTPKTKSTTWGWGATAELGPELLKQRSESTTPSLRFIDSTLGAIRKAPNEMSKPLGPEFLKQHSGSAPELLKQRSGPTELLKQRSGPTELLKQRSEPTASGVKRKALEEMTNSQSKKQSGLTVYHKLTRDRPEIEGMLKRALWQYGLGSSNHFTLPKLLALNIKLAEDLELLKPKFCLNQEIYEEQTHEIALCHLLCDRNAAEPKIDLTITEIEYVNQDVKTGPLDVSKMSKSEKEELLKTINVAEFATNGDIDPAKLPAHLRWYGARGSDRARRLRYLRLSSDTTLRQRSGINRKHYPQVTATKRSQAHSYHDLAPAS